MNGTKCRRNGESSIKQYLLSVMRPMLTPRVLHKVTPPVFLLEFFSVWLYGIIEVLPSLYGYLSYQAVVLNQVFAFILGAEVVVNWMCLRYVDTSLKEDAEKPAYEQQKLDEHDQQLRHRTTHLKKPNRKPSYWRWSYCDKCGILQRPPRCYHCPLCNKCILKKDHHCFFVGRCVGYRNMRFFIMFIFWAIYGTVYSFLHASVYLYLRVLPSAHYADALPFVAFVRRLFGYGSAGTGVMVLMWWGLMFLLILCSFHLLDVIYYMPGGRTMFEWKKGIKVEDTRTLLEQVKAVFGNYFLLNVLVPVHFLFPALEDPINWPTINRVKQTMTKTETTETIS